MKALTRKGFTLTELLVVMAIVVVLAAVSLPTFGKYLETSRETADIELIRSNYDDTLALAVLDAVDGKLDGKVANDAAATAPDLATGDTGIAVSGDTFTVTLASLTPKASFKQSHAGWEYVSNSVGGKAAPNVVGANGGTATATITYSTFPQGKPS